MANNTFTQISFIGRRAASYWFFDGLPEIVDGLCLLINGAILIGLLFISHKWWVFLLLYLMMYPITTMQHRILDFIKARITYPRTGYVSPPIEVPSEIQNRYTVLGLREQTPRVYEKVSTFWFGTVWLFYYGNMWMFLWFRFPLFSPRWSLALTMAAIAAVIYFRNQYGPHSYVWWEVLPIVAIGFITAMLNLENRIYICLPLFIGGVWLLALGSLKLVRYLRVNPKRSELQEDRT
jgi:hypothetical protein